MADISIQWPSHFGWKTYDSRRLPTHDIDQVVFDLPKRSNMLHPNPKRCSAKMETGNRRK